MSSDAFIGLWELRRDTTFTYFRLTPTVKSYTQIFESIRDNRLFSMLSVNPEDLSNLRTASTITSSIKFCFIFFYDKELNVIIDINQIF